MKKIVFLFAFIVLTVTDFQSAHADLLISPLQVTMEGRDRSAKISLVNTSSKRNTYRLEWVQMEQADYLGGYQEPTEVTINDTHLKDFAVFSPRQITLMPQENQIVRVGVRRPADLPDGEYKTHLKFAVIESERIGAQGVNPVAEDAIRVGVQVQFSYSIPVVYRVGDYDCQVSISEPQIVVDPASGSISFDIRLKREGIHGAIGLMQLYHRPNGGEEVLLKELGNVNLFPEATYRDVTLSTDVTGLEPGSLRFVYIKAEGQEDDYVVLAEREVPVGN